MCAVVKRSRRAWIGAIAGAFALLASEPGHLRAAGAEQIVVQLDKAKLVKLPAHVETVVVGNPSIADITMLKQNGLMVVTGKGFGETNIIFVDPAGQALSEAAVRVEASPTSMTVQRGLDRETYTCAPRCQPTVALGDATKFLTDTSTQITSRNSLIAPAAAQH